MMNWLGDHYEWLKALHIISVIAWMAGMLYLPRLFVYHADTEAGSPQSETFKIMERRLMRGIMNPAMILTILFGGLMLWVLWPVVKTEGWIHVKLACVAGLIIAHMFLARCRRAFVADANMRSAKFYRVFNEVPTVLMIVVVIMVVVKPF